jgi:large subunit ribosomal protein L4
VLIMLPEKNENVENSARNLPDVKTLRANYLNIRDLLGYDTLLLPKRSLEVIAGILGDPGRPRPRSLHPSGTLEVG